jgi:hypothetical protein
MILIIKVSYTITLNYSIIQLLDLGNLYKNSRTRSFSNKPKSLIQISSDSYLQPLNDDEYEFDSIDAWQQDFAPFSTLDSPLVGLKDWLKVSQNVY